MTPCYGPVPALDHGLIRTRSNPVLRPEKMEGRGSLLSTQNIAVVGSGISGLAAAWLLSQRHRVTLIERGSRLGGHANTVTCSMPDGAITVGTGFNGYNDSCYPNRSALFGCLGVRSAPSAMGFAVSIGGGGCE